MERAGCIRMAVAAEDAAPMSMTIGYEAVTAPETPVKLSGTVGMLVMYSSAAFCGNTGS